MIFLSIQTMICLYKHNVMIGSFHPIKDLESEHLQYIQDRYDHSDKGQE